MATKESFKETDKLYHFTTFDSAKKIIESNSLRFGRLNNMNDIHETSKSMFAKSNMQEFPEELLNELYNEIYRYRQISLTQDTQDKCGFDLHNMWGLYANKFDGVCLVFDKNKLLEQIKKSKDDIYEGEVSYNRDVDSSVIIDNTKVSSEIQKNAERLFFQKRKEWEHEQEFRLIKKCPVEIKEEYFRFGDSLKFIILSNVLIDVDNVRYAENERKIKLCAKDIPILIYGNGLFEYSLIASDTKCLIWSSKEGYGSRESNKNCEIDI